MTKESSGDEYFQDDIVVTKQSGYGIKIGDWTESGNEAPRFGWRDIIGQISVKGVGANDPDWTQIGSSPFFAYKFAVNDICWFSYHIGHDIVPNSPVHFHAHWISDGTSTANVRWEFTYMYQKGFSQGAFNTTGTAVYAEEAAAGVAHTHHVTETDAVSISGLSEPDGIIYVRIRRVANTSSPAIANSDNIFLLTADIHYQSTNIATIGKAPGFYS